MFVPFWSGEEVLCCSQSTVSDVVFCHFLLIQKLLTFVVSFIYFPKLLCNSLYSCVHLSHSLLFLTQEDVTLLLRSLKTAVIGKIKSEISVVSVSDSEVWIHVKSVTVSRLTILQKIRDFTQLTWFCHRLDNSNAEQTLPIKTFCNLYFEHITRSSKSLEHKDGG